MDMVINYTFLPKHTKYIHTHIVAHRFATNTATSRDIRPYLCLYYHILLHGRFEATN